MTPHEFITKWRASALKERSASQEHFIYLCRLLGEPMPAEADPPGEVYCFERGARKDAGGDGSGSHPIKRGPLMALVRALQAKQGQRLSEDGVHSSTASLAEHRRAPEASSGRKR